MSARMKPDTPASASRLQHRRAVRPTEHLVAVAHRHDRRLGPGLVDAADELDRVIERGSSRQRHRRRALDRRAIGQGVRVRQPDLQHVRPGVDERHGYIQGRRGIGVAGRGEGDEGRAPLVVSLANGLADSSPALRLHARPPSIPAISRSSTAAMSLSPRPDRPSRMTSSLPAALIPSPASRSVSA